MAYTMCSKKVNSISAQYTASGGYPWEVANLCSDVGGTFSDWPAMGNGFWNGPFLSMHLNLIPNVVAVWEPGDFPGGDPPTFPGWYMNTAWGTDPVPNCGTALAAAGCSDAEGSVPFYTPNTLPKPHDSIITMCGFCTLMVIPEFYCTTTGDDAYKVFIRAWVGVYAGNKACDEGDNTQYDCNFSVISPENHFYKPNIQDIPGSVIDFDGPGTHEWKSGWGNFPDDYYGGTWSTQKKYYEYLGVFASADAFCGSVDDWIVRGTYRTYGAEDGADGAGGLNAAHDGELTLAHYCAAT